MLGRLAYCRNTHYGNGTETTRRYYASRLTNAMEKYILFAWYTLGLLNYSGRNTRFALSRLPMVRLVARGRQRLLPSLSRQMARATTIAGHIPLSSPS